MEDTTPTAISRNGTFILIKLGQCILINFTSRISYGMDHRVWDYKSAKLKLINQSN